MHGFFQQTETPQKTLPTVNHTGTIAGPSAHRHMHTCAWFAFWRSCFREVNCVTVGDGGGTSRRVRTNYAAPVSHIYQRHYILGELDGSGSSCYASKQQ